MDMYTVVGVFNEKDNVCGELWIQCNNYGKWLHVKCTNQRKKGKTQLDNLISWNCDSYKLYLQTVLWK